jgi:CO dehydrogenase/acetyl-CoA synthase epsilon subunit
MLQATQQRSHSNGVAQEVAIHMIASAARILLMLGTALLVGEMVAGPARKLLEKRHNRKSVNEDGEPAD